MFYKVLKHFIYEDDYKIIATTDSGDKVFGTYSCVVCSTAFRETRRYYFDFKPGITMSIMCRNCYTRMNGNYELLWQYAFPAWDRFFRRAIARHNPKQLDRMIADYEMLKKYLNRK